MAGVAHVQGGHSLVVNVLVVRNGVGLWGVQCHGVVSGVGHSSVLQDGVSALVVNVGWLGDSDHCKVSMLGHVGMMSPVGVVSDVG